MLGKPLLADTITYCPYAAAVTSLFSVRVVLGLLTPILSGELITALYPSTYATPGEISKSNILSSESLVSKLIENLLAI